MKTIIDFIHDFILPHESEFDHNGNVITEHDPDDPGEATKYGIDADSHPDIDIENLTENDAVSIYVEEFCKIKWITPSQKLFTLVDFPYPAHYVFFDAAVNMGTHQAVIFLQRAMGITVDGKVGDITRSKTLLYTASPMDLCLSMILCRESLYHQFAKNGTKRMSAEQAQKKLNGWLNRCHDLEKYIRTI